MKSDAGSAPGFVLRAYHKTRQAEEVTRALDIVPTTTFRAGDASSFPEIGPIPEHGWILSSRDARWPLQLASLVERLQSMRAELDLLMAQGWEFDLILSRTDEGPKPEIPTGLRETLEQLGIVVSLSVI